ncbi:MAG: ABC transporter permease [Xanthomonadaceae bacterium]|nr:ABC transporter permease [Xanthomonadaceae bacterium]
MTTADKFKSLLRREFWENKGGFFWAPIVAGGIGLFFTLLAIVGTFVFSSKAEFHASGDFQEVETHMQSAEGLQAIGVIGDGSLLVGIGLALVVMTFVVFFYALGSLYDERKDRSVLFWKSLPVSDTQTVFSKVAWALLLAPVLSIAIGLLIGLGLWLLIGLATALHGMPGASALFTESHPFQVIAGALSIVPLYAAWALPAIGWLMFCSAWARSKPFLWAVLIPIMAGALISWLDMLPGIEIPHENVWYILLLRGLLSVIPMTWYASESVYGGLQSIEVDGPADLTRVLDLTHGWNAFASVDLWIGVIIGVAFIVAAIRLRRWRDEG